MKDFRRLMVWQKAHELTIAIYRATEDFPKQELYGLTSQLRRSASSIAANLAEGCGRGSDAELARFSQIAAGSASETEYHLLLAKDLKLLAPQSHEELDTEVNGVKRMLNAFLQHLRAEKSEST